MSIQAPPTYRTTAPIFNTKHHPIPKAPPAKGLTREVFIAKLPPPEPEPEPEPEIVVVEEVVPEPEVAPDIVVFEGLQELGFIPAEEEPEKKIIVIYEDLPNVDLEIEELPQ